MAPRALGPYSQAIAIGNQLYCSGQTPVEPLTMQLVQGGIEIQTKRVLENLTLVLNTAGLTLSNVIKVNVFLTDMEMFASMNKVYEERFGGHKPARSTIAVRALPLNALIEIECIAEIK